MDIIDENRYLDIELEKNGYLGKGIFCEKWIFSKSGYLPFVSNRPIQVNTHRWNQMSRNHSILEY